ncbi:MAG: alcohol dehydrogenase catalytic domain-containing protein [Sphingomonadaceae bacterium]
MKAVVYHGPHDVRVDDVPKPILQSPEDVILRVTLASICGTDLHPYRGTMPGMQSGTILGHEFVGVVEECGEKVKNLRVGDRVLVPSTIACGYCAFCTQGLYAQCENANPMTHSTAFFGGPADAGGYQGGQAEYVRVPFATVGPLKVPDEVADEQAIVLTDIFPTGYFAADLANVGPGDAVAVFGAGPVGLMSMESAKLMDAGRVFAVDNVQGRLDMAAQRGFETINFADGDPVQQIMDLTGGSGVDCVIDAVGVDARCAVGHAPSAGHDCSVQAIEWEARCAKKAGTLSIVGLYPDKMQDFPLNMIQQKNLTLRAGNCNHRKYIPLLMRTVQDGTVDPSFIVTDSLPLEKAPDAYREYDQKQGQHVKIVLETPASTQVAG